MYCFYSNTGVVSSLLSLRDWRPVSRVPDQQRQIAVDRKATPAGRAEFCGLCCCDTSTDKQAALQRIVVHDALRTSRRRLLLGAASVLGSTGKPDGRARLTSCRHLTSSSTQRFTGLPPAPQAGATRVVSVEGEGELEVFEFKVYLSVVALRGSVPNQWVEDFKQVPLWLSDSNL